MSIQETLARSKIDLENFYRDQRNNPPLGQPVQRVDYGEDDDSGNIFEGREDDERITSQLD